MTSSLRLPADEALKSVEESCDVEFFRCMINAPCPLLCWCDCHVSHPPCLTDLALLALHDIYLFSIAKRTLVWHTIFKWQWLHCVCGGLSSRTIIARWTLLPSKTGMEKLQEQWNKCAEVRGDYEGKETSQCCCSVFLYTCMRPETFGTILL